MKAEEIHWTLDEVPADEAPEVETRGQGMANHPACIRSKAFERLQKYVEQLERERGKGGGSR